MSKIDRHISGVRTKLTLNLLVRALAWTLLGAGIVVIVAILCDRLLDWRLPRASIWFYGLLAAAIVAGAYRAWRRRPSARDAAVQIDTALDLKEKFSTALYVRGSADPFAKATLVDAEHAADNISLRNRFPLHWPRVSLATLLTAIAALGLFLPNWHYDLFGQRARQEQKMAQQQAQDVQARDQVHQALVALAAAPTEVASDARISAARREMEALQHQSHIDAPRAEKIAQDALDQMNAMKKRIADAAVKAQVAEASRQSFSDMPQPTDPNTLPGKAQNDLKNGDLDKVSDDLQKLADQYSKMKPQEKEKEQKAMQNLANALKNNANNPKTAQKIQQALTKAGASAAQAKQLSQLIKQAAQGNTQAQQQAKQLANQVMQQMNGGQGPSAAQMQSIKSAMAGAQKTANQQATSQGLASAAQSMASAMAAANAAQSGQQPGQQQSPANQQAANQANSALQQAAASAQAQLQAGQAQAAAQQAANAAQGGQGQRPGGQAQGPGNGPNGQQAGNGNNPNGQQPGNGGGGQGVAQGGIRPPGVATPFTTAQKYDPTQEQNEGKIIATNLVKAAMIKGESKLKVADQVRQVAQDAADEVDQGKVSAQAQRAVQRYFSDLTESDDSGK